MHLPGTASALDPILGPLISRLIGVPGVAAIALGGSRARGTAAATSDTDIGLYYREGAEPRAVDIREATRGLIDNPDLATITEVGEWGRWVVGGAWLRVGGMKVDLLYRCVDAVRTVICDCRAGRVTMDYQPGHPHGFCSAIWMGECVLALASEGPKESLSQSVEALPEARAELDAWPLELRAGLARIVERIESVGLERLGEPFVRHLEAKLWEMRLSGRRVEGRALYVTVAGRRVVIVLAFQKTTPKTPRRMIELALKRARSVPL